MNTGILSWEFHFTNKVDQTEFVKLYAEKINEVTEEGFEYKFGFPIETLREILNSSDLVGLVLNDTKELLGFSFISVLEKLLQGKRVVWVDKVALAKKAQRQGLATSKLVDELQSILGPIGWIGCCTQNTTLINAFSRIGINSFPLKTPYGSEKGIGPWTYLALNVKQVKEKFKSHKTDLDIDLNSNYGHLQHGYPYKINFSKSYLLPELDENLKSIHFNSNEGDCLLLLTEL